MAARLKLFAARMGFFDTVVATTSRKAALDAWGVHQDLFKSGDAVETQDPAAYAALEEPGVVFRRTVASAEPYAVAAALTAERLVPKGTAKSKSASTPADAVAPRPPPPPDRSALDSAERALKDAERERERARHSVAARHAALEREAEAIEAEHARLVRQAERTRAKAEADFVRRGGAA